jgi:hypothetical protein
MKLGIRKAEEAAEPGCTCATGLPLGGRARYLRWAGQAVAEGLEPFEESPDITEQGGREPDPGKPAGKCHRKNTADDAGGLDVHSLANR